MDKSIAIKWQTFTEIECPCADISFQWISERKSKLVIAMHFSRVLDGINKDLIITLKRPISIQWEDESFNIIDFPEKPPKCNHERFKNWTYPLLIIKNSKWANTYAASSHTAEEFKNHKVTHYAFIAMNDTLFVLSNEKPHLMLVDSKDTE